MANYCNATTDLFRAYPRIEEYKELRTLRGFVVHSGSVYKIGNVGYGEQLIENNLPLTAVTTLQSVAAGKYYYDADTDILYVQATSGAVTDAANVYRWGSDWDTLKSWAVQQASEMLEGMLDARFPTPLPENPFGSSTRRYDGIIIQTTAQLACSLLVGRREPADFASDGSANNLSARLWNAALNNVAQLNDGRIRLQYEVTPDEIGGAQIISGSANTSVGMIQLRGMYSGADDALWMLKITTGGDLGTARYKISTDNGATYSGEETTAVTWTSIGSGLEVRFFARSGGSSSFVVTDTWQLVLTASDRAQSRPRVGSATLIS